MQKTGKGRHIIITGEPGEGILVRLKKNGGWADFIAYFAHVLFKKSQILY